MEQKYELGLIGLGTMGQNLLMNMGENGFAVAGYDKDLSKVEELKKIGASYPITAVNDAKTLVAVLKKPRIVMMLVPAGRIVDAVINDVLPFLEPGDIIVDGGNSHFTDTNRRVKELEDRKIHFVGMGISGGAEGARKGPSMMPGGNETSWNRIKPIFEATAAKVNGESCVDFMGQNSAGHYVKMVHNGIEYAQMELIAEAYDVMKRGLKMDNKAIGSTFKKWNNGRMHSFLIEITGYIFDRKDDLGTGDLVDAILDQTRQKGTGKWTSQDAMDIQVPVPAIDLAVSMRDLSGYKEERIEAAKILKGAQPGSEANDQERILDQLESTLYFGFMIAFVQGMAQLRAASEAYEYDLALGNVAKIWRGGCIIRASMLENLMKAYQKNPDLKNLLLDPEIADLMNGEQKAARDIAGWCLQSGLPAMVLTNAISYFDGYRSERLPANLTQAQRDFFGSHTYERLDRPGIFHTEWMS